MQNISLRTCCENVYRRVKGSTEKELNSINDLSKALHLIGRNPSRRSLEHYWSKHEGVVSFGEFLRLADESEAELKMADLLDAFEIVAGNSTGVVDKLVLMSALTTKGERMLPDEVEELLAEHHTEVDYLNLCRVIMDLNSKLWSPADVVDSSVGTFDTKTFTRRKKGTNCASISAIPSFPANVQGWKVTSLQGCFYKGSDGRIASHQYTLTISEQTSVWISIQPRKDLEIDGDTELLLFSEGKGRCLIGCTQVKDAKGRYCLRSTLRVGQYLLVPFTTGCRMSSSTRTSSGTKESPNQGSLRSALRLAFDCLDLDGDGLLGYGDFSLFNAWVKGKEMSQEEWQLLKRDSSNDKGLTEEEFVSLVMNQGEDEVCHILNKLGFSDSLKMSQACPFTLTIHCERGKPTLRAMPASDGSGIVERTLSRVIVEQGIQSHIQNFNDLSFHILELQHRVSMAVRNKSHSNLAIRLDCSASQNCLSHRGTLDCIVPVPPRTCLIAHHLIQEKEDLPWMTTCQETLLK